MAMNVNINKETLKNSIEIDKADARENITRSVALLAAFVNSIDCDADGLALVADKLDKTRKLVELQEIRAIKKEAVLNLLDSGRVSKQ
jgi:hypothetical protein